MQPMHSCSISWLRHLESKQKSDEWSPQQSQTLVDFGTRSESARKTTSQRDAKTKMFASPFLDVLTCTKPSYRANEVKQKVKRRKWRILLGSLVIYSEWNVEICQTFSCSYHLATSQAIYCTGLATASGHSSSIYWRALEETMQCEDCGTLQRQGESSQSREIETRSLQY